MERKKIQKSKTLNIRPDQLPTKKPTTKRSSGVLNMVSKLGATNLQKEIDPIPPKGKLSSVNVLSSNISSHLELESNLEFNDQMEDVGIQIKNFAGSPNKFLYGIFDGHNGVTVAKLASQCLPSILEKEILKNPKQIEKNIITSFKLFDDKCEQYVTVGCTATIVYIDIETKELYCANIGDSSCMIITKEKAEKISYDDKIMDKNEIERVKKEGGYIEDERLNGILAISRAFGDYILKGCGLTCLPHIIKMPLKDIKYCVIASDGIWDVIDENQLYDISHKSKTAKNFAEQIVKTAVKLESEDNISCVAIKID